MKSLFDLERTSEFVARHVGVSEGDDQRRMLETVGYASLDDLLADAVPASIREKLALALPPAAPEAEVAAELRDLAGRNRVTTSMIGLGYYDTITPPVIRRNVLENPAWYTAYTPYQPEISQGRLEALLNFQTVVEDLTALPIAGASLLDEGTAAAEAMALAHRVARSGDTFVVDADVLPQTLSVVQTRALPLGITVVTHDFDSAVPDGDVFGVLVQYPGASGTVRDLRPIVSEVHERGAQVVVAADLLALTLLVPPGEVGADIAVGTSQRFGVPIGFGGPHAGYIAIRAGLERQLPGRLVGVSVDADGAPAYRLALQTREQHIRREKATSNICTAQVLLANIASMYAVYHGPNGLTAIAERVRRMASALAAGLREGGVDIGDTPFFDTITAQVPGRAHAVLAAALAEGINLRLVDDDTVSISCDEVTRRGHLVAVWRAFGLGLSYSDVERLDADAPLPASLARTSPFLSHPVFSAHRSETAMLRYLRRLAERVGPRHDPARLVHDEAERHDRDGTDQPAGLRQPASVRAGRPVRRLRPVVRRPDEVAGRDHRLRRRVAAAERRRARRVRRSAGHRRVPPFSGRHASRRVPDPGQRARHQCGERRAGRPAGGRRQDVRRRG